MDPRPVRRILGKIGSERGRGNEKRVLDACKLTERPSWMLAARRATPAEDHAGIDVVIESDVGKLYVQVKSSRGGKAAFGARRRSARIAVVVARSGDSQSALLRKVVGELAKIRAEYLKERKREPGAKPPMR
jgi:hypothetical protein